MRLPFAVLLALAACAVAPTFSTSAGTSSSTGATTASTTAATTSTTSASTSAGTTAATTTATSSGTTGATTGASTGPATSSSGATTGATTGTTGGSTGSCGVGTVVAPITNDCCQGQSGFTPAVVVSSFAGGGATATLADDQGYVCGGSGTALVLTFDSLALQTYDAGFGANGIYGTQIVGTSIGSGTGGSALSGTLTLTSADPDAGLQGSYALDFCAPASQSCVIEGTFDAPPCQPCL